MVEFGAPVFDLLPDNIPDAMNKAMMIVQFCWNCGLPSLGKLKSDEYLSMVDEVSILTSELLKIKRSKASELIKMMIKRKEYLLPFDVQPKIPLIMFIRKEKSYQISQFKLESLELSTDEYLPNEEDKKITGLIDKLDKFIEIEEDYGKWEMHYLKTENICLERFGKWLDFKKVDQNLINDFLFDIQIYMNFIYSYGHDIKCNLKTVIDEHFDDFFSDHVLRKATVNPSEYSYWPPAMKLFYQFLENIGYMNNASKIIKIINKFEPLYINILQKRYG